MDKPKELKKDDLDMNIVGSEILATEKLSLDTIAETKKWLEQNEIDIFIFERNEKGFEDWTEDDYARMCTENHFEPYAIFTNNYVVMHDYC